MWKSAASAPRSHLTRNVKIKLRDIPKNHSISAGAPSSAFRSQEFPMSGRRRDRRKKPRKPPKPRSTILHNPKRTGEHSEIAFLYRSDQRRFAISKPFGDSERYDFILDNRPRPRVKLFRIQVKCTECLR